MKNIAKINYLILLYHMIYNKINCVLEIGANYMIMLLSFFYSDFVKSKNIFIVLNNYFI